MSKELYLKIDDDVARTIAKVSRANSADLTLVFPKGAMVLSNVSNLKLLKKQIDLLGKNVTILTNDQSGQQRALEAGFDLMTFEMMRKGLHTAVHRPREVSPEEAEPKSTPPIFRPKAPVKVYVEPDTIKRFPVVPEEFEYEQTQPSGKKGWFFAVLLSAILIAVAVLILLPAANITIYAHTQPLSRDMQITVDKNAKAMDAKNLILPSQFLDKDQEFTKTYAATGKQNVGVKAQGLVQIYNYTGKTLKFSVKTTTLTVGNNIYRLAHDVSGIKPTRNIAGTSNPDPASLSPQVTVVADQPGDTYNVPGGTRFEIHNLVLGDVPQLLYAATTVPLDGGVSKFTTTITQADLDNARNDLKQTVIDSAKAQMLNKYGLVLLDSGTQFQVNNITFDKQVNDAVVSFNGQISGHIKALAFDKAQLQDLVTQRINYTLDSSQELYGTNAQWDMNFKSIDLDKGSGVLAVKYQGLIESKVDPKEIEAKSRGKTVSDLKETLLSDPKIDGADISLKPFWAKTLPNLSGRINVEVTVK